LALPVGDTFRPCDHNLTPVSDVNAKKASLAHALDTKRQSCGLACKLLL